MRMRYFRIIMTLAVITALALLYPQPTSRLSGNPASSAYAANLTNTASKAPVLHAAAPSLSLLGMDGKSYSLEAYRGKPVILNFWASWCGPCKEEAPYLVKAYNKHRNDIHLLAVNLTFADSESDARKFAQDYGFNFPVLLDSQGTAGRLYHIRPIPTTFFLGADGVIKDVFLGSLNEEELEKRITALMKPAKAS